MVYPMLGRMRKIGWNKIQFKSRLMRPHGQFGYGRMLKERKESKIMLNFLAENLGE